MFERPIHATREAATTALADLRADSNRTTGRDLIEHLVYLNTLRRQIEHDTLHTIARLSTEGEFERRATRPAPAIADLLQVAPAHARRLVRTATAVFPTSLTGEALQPKLPATATALAGYEIDQAHAEVIDRALNTGAAHRIGLERWTAVEVQLADWARTYPPDQLAHLAHELIDRLDEDGPQPGEDHAQLNELNMAKLPDGGLLVKARLDSPTGEVFARAVRASLLPETDEGTTLGQRQADALGAICEHALDDAYLPAEGGQRPHITAVFDYDRLVEHARGASLEFGGSASAAQLRRILCDSCVAPAVLGGDSVPLDLGRARRTATSAQRAALAARDGGCAHPGCDKTPSWCSVHHVIHWIDGGPTDLDNLVFLCLQHHNMVHQSGWVIRMRNGLPEFIPPKWVDTTQTPRTNRHLVLV